MTLQLLIVGNTSEAYHLGAILARAAQVLDLSVSTCDNNFAGYAPSMKSTWGKAFFKFAGKRPIEWWSLNKHLTRTIKEACPELVLVTGIFPLQDQVFYTCAQTGTKIVNYLTDDPWQKHYCSKFLSNLARYDLILSTKTRLLSDLARSGAKNIKFLPFAYDPYLHHRPDFFPESDEKKFSTDICFIGTGDADRLDNLDALASLDNSVLRIYGQGWERIPVRGWQRCPAVFGLDLRRAIFYSKLSLGLVRRSNRDESTLRTFEIAACGGCGIYEDTKEHREILAGYPDYGFFSSPQDLTDKCKWLLDNPLEREQMRELGIKLIVKESNTYVSRLKQILVWVGE